VILARAWISKLAFQSFFFLNKKFPNRWCVGRGACV
jgi:hypothetical protein